MGTDPEIPTDQRMEEAEARSEFEEQARVLDEELRTGRINHAEYERRKAEAWEVYRARSGVLRPDDEHRGTEGTG